MERKFKPPHIFVEAMLVCWAIVQMYPLLYMFMTSLKTETQIQQDPFGLPDPVSFAGYTGAWEGKTNTYSFETYFANSGIITVCTLILLCLVSLLAGYMLARHKFPGNKFIYLFIVCLIAVPIQALIVPIFVMFEDLHMLNKIWPMILLYTAFNLPFSIIIMKTNFEAIPKEIEEAALVDGCNTFRVFWHVGLPMSRGSIATIAIVNLTAVWSEFMYASTLLVTPESRTLPVAISMFNTSMYNSTVSTLMAGLSMASIPLLIAYFIFQKQIVKGMAVGAIK